LARDITQRTFIALVNAVKEGSFKLPLDVEDFYALLSELNWS
jgi:hypothetical protein